MAKAWTLADQMRQQEGGILGVADDVRKAIRLVFECAHQGKSDFCGEQRAFHLPRLNEAFLLLGKLFPKEVAGAMLEARDAYGDLVAGDNT